MGLWHFATSEDLPCGESKLKLSSSHLIQTPCLCHLCTLLPLRSRRGSQSQSHKSFKGHNGTTTGRQMFNKNTAQKKLLLRWVRWILFWQCRCCKRFNFHSQLFCGFVSEAEHMKAVHRSEHSSSSEEGWFVTTASQNWSTLVKQLTWFWEICLQVICYSSAEPWMTKMMLK